MMPSNGDITSPAGNERSAMQEQREIASLIGSTTSTIDTTISKFRKQIAKSHEYRTALISATVRSKINVREAAKV